LDWCGTIDKRCTKRSELPLELERDPRIWKAGRLIRGHQTLTTGFADLDRALSGGWPVGVLTELLTDFYGIGELRLLMPALTALSKRSEKTMPSKILMIAPPYIPYAPAFVRQGMNISGLLVVHCRHQTEVSWVTEQALRSGSCAAVLAWFEGADSRALRRLQLAAEEGAAAGGGTENRGCWTVLFRPSRFRSQRSPAALRIRFRPGRSSRISMNIFKNRGGRPCDLELRVPE
jgi:hypothetical protein